MGTLLKLFTGFSPLGWLSGISLKTWGWIIGAIALGLVVWALKSHWADYKEQLVESGKKDVIIDVVQGANFQLLDELDKGNESIMFSNLIANQMWVAQEKSRKAFGGIIDEKDTNVAKIEFDTTTDDDFKAKAKSIVRLNSIVKAYCATQPDCAPAVQ